jgi:hypothetical protein
MFPDHLTHRVQRRGAPPISYYDAMGATGFRTAAENQLALRHGLGDIFVGAATRFADLRGALNTLSDAVLFPHSKDPIERVLRQASDDFRRDFGG